MRKARERESVYEHQSFVDTSPKWVSAGWDVCNYDSHLPLDTVSLFNARLQSLSIIRLNIILSPRDWIFQPLLNSVSVFCCRDLQYKTSNQHAQSKYFISLSGMHAWHAFPVPPFMCTEAHFNYLLIFHHSTSVGSCWDRKETSFMCLLIFSLLMMKCSASF